MPGPPPKREGRQRRNKSGLAEVVQLPGTAPVERTDIPPAAEHWSGEVKEAWLLAWESGLGAYWLDTDLGIVTRCFDLRNQIAVYEAAAHEEGAVVSGSAGQLAIHPLIREADTLRDDLLAVEDRIGMSPMARLKLGVQLGEAAGSLDKLNDLLEKQSGASGARRARNDETFFSRLTVKDLRAECKARTLPTRGRKAELIARLEEHETEHADDIDPADDPRSTLAGVVFETDIVS